MKSLRRLFCVNFCVNWNKFCLPADNDVNLDTYLEFIGIGYC